MLGLNLFLINRTVSYLGCSYFIVMFIFLVDKINSLDILL